MDLDELKLGKMTALCQPKSAKIAGMYQPVIETS